MIRNYKVFVTGGFFVLFLVILLFANTNMVPLEKQADMLLKVLGYDRSLMSREGKYLRIGIIYTEMNTESVDTWEQIVNSLDQITSSGRMVGGKKLAYSGILFTSEDDLKQIASMLKVAVFYVTPGNEKNLFSIIRVARSEGILTFSGVIDYVTKGIAAGVELVDGNPKIVIHLSSAEEQGANFKAELLKVAKVIQ